MATTVLLWFSPMRVAGAAYDQLRSVTGLIYQGVTGTPRRAYDTVNTAIASLAVVELKVGPGAEAAVEVVQSVSSISRAAIDRLAAVPHQCRDLLTQGRTVVDSVRSKKRESMLYVVQVTSNALHELRHQSESSLPTHLADMVNKCVDTIHSRIIRHLAPRNGLDLSVDTLLMAEPNALSPAVLARDTRALLISYRQKPHALTPQLNTRIRRMMHYNIDLRPFEATVVLDPQGRERQDTEHATRTQNDADTQPYCQPYASTTCEARPTTSPVPCTPLSFPVSPRERRALISNFSARTSDLLERACFALEQPQEWERAHKASHKGSRGKHVRAVRLQKKSSIAREARGRMGMEEGGQGGVASGDAGAGPASRRDALAGSHADSESPGDSSWTSHSATWDDTRFAYFSTDPMFCHGQIEVSCGGYCATKRGSGLYRTVKTEMPVRRSGFTYFEMHISHLSNASSVAVGGMAPGNDALALAIGVSTRGLPLNSMAGSDATSVALMADGSIAQGSIIKRSDAEALRCGDVVGILTASAPPNDRKAGLERQKIGEDAQHVTVSFFLNGQRIHPECELQLDGEVELLPTLSILSQDTFLMGHFASDDLRYAGSVQLPGSVAGDGSSLFALDGSPIVF